jgi:hypothetical protein
MFLSFQFKRLRIVSGDKQRLDRLSQQQQQRQQQPDETQKLRQPPEVDASAGPPASRGQSARAETDAIDQRRVRGIASPHSDAALRKATE